MERTLTIIKPDSISKGNSGAILAMLEQEGFKILAIKQLKLDEETARRFYAEHKDKPFFERLIAYMTEGPVIVAALERDDAVKELRNLMGATDPTKAAEGTIRKDYGESITRNAIHGSANFEDASREIAFFFSEADLI